MSTSSIRAGKTICELSGWDVSNLALQKLLYIAHMYHLGRHNEPLIDDYFEAWMYGPVEPSLYRHARGFGSEAVRNVFHKYESVRNGSEFDLLNETVEATRGLSGAYLVSFTHWEKGAWYKVYDPEIRGTIIPNNMILEEYNERVANRKQRQ